jgi:hypothetical protein
MTILDENWPPTTPEREATRPRMAKPSNLILIAAAMVVLSCVLCGAVRCRCLRDSDSSIFDDDEMARREERWHSSARLGGNLYSS